jgi:hypothetical protein
MKPFEQPDLRPIGKGKYELHEAWSYVWEKDEILRAIVIPQGFISDGASAPRILWTFTGIIPDGLVRAGALCHDFLYVNGGILPENSYQQVALYGWVNDPAVWTRKNADRLFCRIMKESGVGKIKRRLAYRGVRMFGWMFWKNNK